MYIYAYIQTYIYIHIHICIYTHIHTRTHTHFRLRSLTLGCWLSCGWEAPLPPVVTSCTLKVHYADEAAGREGGGWGGVQEGAGGGPHSQSQSSKRAIKRRTSDGRKSDVLHRHKVAAEKFCSFCEISGPSVIFILVKNKTKTIGSSPWRRAALPEPLFSLGSDLIKKKIK